MTTQCQNAFLQTAREVGALSFGQFELKSGRISPYFFNAGAFCTGESLNIMASAYAERIHALIQAGVPVDTLYGPAYKGIPLVAAVAVLLAERHNLSLPWTFNRKEAKNHGEGGMLVGAVVKGKNVLIIDDVLTAGTAIRESLNLLHEHGGHPVAVVVALDRQESVGESGMSALQHLRRQEKLLTDAVINFTDLQNLVNEDPELSRHQAAMAAYREQYGVKS
ncbi:MAG: orotate phosphoribosyltransferase [Cardiobacteriaceae bacterium]|nr:orotate phosphoribosyltransferase [Cardiobacteriaceae bacterium]